MCVQASVLEPQVDNRMKIYANNNPKIHSYKPTMTVNQGIKI